MKESEMSGTCSMGQMINTDIYTVVICGCQGNRTVRRWRCKVNINILKRHAEGGNCIELIQEESNGELL
jgi:hypothetical protein